MFFPPTNKQTHTAALWLYSLAIRLPSLNHSKHTRHVTHAHPTSGVEPPWNMPSWRVQGQLYLYWLVQCVRSGSYWIFWPSLCCGPPLLRCAAAYMHKFLLWSNLSFLKACNFFRPSLSYMKKWVRRFVEEFWLWNGCRSSLEGLEIRPSFVAMDGGPIRGRSSTKTMSHSTTRMKEK